MVDSYDAEFKKTGWLGTFWSGESEVQMKIHGHLTLDTSAGFIEGEGEDQFGQFLLEGFISTNQYVTFTRKYADQENLVHFRGMLNIEKTCISGTYGNDFSGKAGRFNLRSADYIEEQVQEDKVPEWEVIYENALKKHK